MRWDLAACPVNDWFASPSGGTTPAEDYLGGSDVQADCEAGLNAALTQCKSIIFIAFSV